MEINTDSVLERRLGYIQQRLQEKSNPSYQQVDLSSVLKRKAERSNALLDKTEKELSAALMDRKNEATYKIKELVEELNAQAFFQAPTFQKENLQARVQVLKQTQDNLTDQLEDSENEMLAKSAERQELRKIVTDLQSTLSSAKHTTSSFQSQMYELGSRAIQSLSDNSKN